MDLFNPVPPNVGGEPGALSSPRDLDSDPLSSGEDYEDEDTQSDLQQQLSRPNNKIPPIFSSILSSKVCGKRERDEESTTSTTRSISSSEV